MEPNLIQIVGVVVACGLLVFLFVYGIRDFRRVRTMQQAQKDAQISEAKRKEQAAENARKEKERRMDECDHKKWLSQGADCHRCRKCHKVEPHDWVLEDVGWDDYYTVCTVCGDRVYHDYRG